MSSWLWRVATTCSVVNPDGIGVFTDVVAIVAAVGRAIGCFQCFSKRDKAV